MIASPTTVCQLNVPGARLHYEVRGSGPLVALVGSPMDSDAFAPLADELATDHTVLTLDPRGINRSPVQNVEQDSTPEMRAEDLSWVLAELDAGPAVVLGSSGGAVTALALLQAHPDRVHTLVAHEPPLEELLADRDVLRVGGDAIVEAYRTEGSGAAWALFLRDANIDPAGFANDSDGPPFAPGEPDPQQLADERHFFLHEMRPTTQWCPDLGALAAVRSRIVIGVGANSTGQVCERTSAALAAALDLTTTTFPGGHIGFVENPKAFATRLRDVLATA